MSKVICFYHDDMDGLCSAAIVNWAVSEEVHCYKVNYGLPFPWDVIEKEDMVFMVDFALKPDEMDKLLSMCNTFIWIDHHKSSIEAIKREISGLRRIGVGACELVWEWFKVTEECPEAIKLIGDFDVWNHQDPFCIPFHYGMETLVDSPTHEVWAELLGRLPFGKLVSIVNQGENILKYIKQDYKTYMEMCAFKTTFQGISTIAINRGLVGSTIFDDLPNREDYAIFCTFFKVKEGFWKISLYGNPAHDIDVSKIAMTYGGGGHKMAAGFEAVQLPFQLDFERQNI